MLSFVFPRLLSVEAVHEPSLRLQLQECSQNRRLRAQGHAHYGPHQNLLLRHSLCLFGMLGWRLCLPQLPLKSGVPSLSCTPAFCSAQSTALGFSNVCMADVALIWVIWGSHKLFQGIIMHGNTAISGTGKNMCKPGLPMMP